MIAGDDRVPHAPRRPPPGDPPCPSRPGRGEPPAAPPARGPHPADAPPPGHPDYQTWCVAGRRSADRALVTAADFVSDLGRHRAEAVTPAPRPAPFRDRTSAASGG